MKRNEHPDDALLLVSIGGDIDVATEDTISEHLSHCKNCQQRLELLASDISSRDQICRVLRREAESSRSSGTGLWSGGDAGQTRSSIEDFAVSLLLPSDRDDSLGRLGESNWCHPPSVVQLVSPTFRRIGVTHPQSLSINVSVIDVSGAVNKLDTEPVTLTNSDDV